MILGENGEKMSKSRGNVINPDDIVNQYGADTLRMYEMFMGPLEATKPWNTRGVEGVYRFLNRVWRLYVAEDGGLNPKIGDGPADASFMRVWHKTIKKVTEDIEALRFNTAISQLMIFVNEAYKQERLPRQAMENFVQLLSPFAPHIAEELWQRLGHDDTITYVPWPAYDERWTVDEEVEIVLQVGGKIADRVRVSADAGEQELERLALENAKVRERIGDREVRKVIVVAGKLVNVVVG